MIPKGQKRSSFTTPASLSRLTGSAEHPLAEHLCHRARVVVVRTQGAAAAACPTEPS